MAQTRSDISNRLPETAVELGRTPYVPDSSKKLAYPNRKYDIRRISNFLWKTCSI